MSEDIANTTAHEPEQRINRLSEVWPERARAVIETARMRQAEKATRISPSAMLEVLSALDGYWDAIESSDLSERAKGIYMEMADGFVRWMRGDFVPGSRKAPYRIRRDRAATFQTLPENRCAVSDAK